MAGTIQAMISALRQVENYEQKLKDASESALGVALSKSVKEFIKPVRDNFDKYVQDFYNSYSPKYYGRRGSMYDILELEQEQISANAVAITIDFNDSVMTYRNGGTGLMEHTFVEGFHGGASGTDKNGITEGYPHYRAPLYEWTHWGNAAAFSESPYERFDEWLTSYWEGSEFQTIFEKYVNEELERALSYITMFG